MFSIKIGAESNKDTSHPKFSEPRAHEKDERETTRQSIKLDCNNKTAMSKAMNTDKPRIEKKTRFAIELEYQRDFITSFKQLELQLD